LSGSSCDTIYIQVERKNVSDFLKWLAGSPVLTAALIVILGALALMYVVAFLQGREVSFWPPKIGARPVNTTTGTVTHQSDEAAPGDTNPIVGKGTVLDTAAGDKVKIESDFYGGANATLFRGRNLAGLPVIVKVYWRGLAPNSPAWDLFKQEQRITEVLDHRNIVKTLDHGLFSGYPFTVLEYFGGGTLRDWLRTHDRIPGADLMAIAGQVADAVDYAHSRGVVHRDIQPGNILFASDPRGRIALGDFGIARILGAVIRAVTAAEPFVGLWGSPGYLAPETLQADLLSTRSDIYSFGVVLYEMIAGRMPFGELEGAYAIIQAKVSRDAPDIRSYRADVPSGVAARLAQTLSRDPTSRPESTRAVLAGIENDIGRL
jgi:eukaryotic-like serine/threonine-protein kinase